MLLEELHQLSEWVDPGPPCTVCGKPHGEHTVRLVKKNPKVHHMNDDDEWVDHDVENAEDHEFKPVKGYKALTQDEAKVIGFDKLSGKTLPDDIYDAIDKARAQIKRVGKSAGFLKAVK